MFLATIAPGRMRDIQSVMAEVMVPLMAEYGIEPVAFWATPDDTHLYWVARHATLDAIGPDWDRFHADPRWTEELKRRTGGTPFVTGQSRVPLIAFGPGAALPEPA